MQISLQPGARVTDWVGLHGERLKVRVHAPPVDGRANAELIEFLSTQFAVTKAQVHIETGAVSRQKRVRIARPKVLPDALIALGLSHR